MSDMVNGPKHYRGDRVMRIIEEFGLGFKDGNVIKYVLRYPEKNGVEDLKKARWYLDRLIAEKEGATDAKPIDAAPAEPESEFDTLKVGDMIMSTGTDRKYEVLSRWFDPKQPAISVRPVGTEHKGITIPKWIYCGHYRKVVTS